MALKLPKRVTRGVQSRVAKFSSLRRLRCEVLEQRVLLAADSLLADEILLEVLQTHQRPSRQSLEQNRHSHDHHEYATFGAAGTAFDSVAPPIGQGLSPGWSATLGSEASTQMHHGPVGSFEFFADPISRITEAHSVDATIDEPSVPRGTGLNPLSSIPALESDPSAPASLYLDFDGHFEAVWGGFRNVTTRVYDADGDETTFSDDELARIAEIWERTAEDFAPFNLNVTTVEPAVLAEGMPSDAANGIALRVAIGGSWSDWYSNSAGGVAYRNVFTNFIPNVVYVFSNNLGDDAYYVSEVSSHEAGHGFGLAHQSLYDENNVRVAEYHPGDGYWAPIMGGGLPEVSTWHYGPSATSAFHFQDDLASITRDGQRLWIPRRRPCRHDRRRDAADDRRRELVVSGHHRNK